MAGLSAIFMTSGAKSFHWKGGKVHARVGFSLVGQSRFIWAVDDVLVLRFQNVVMFRVAHLSPTEAKRSEIEKASCRCTYGSFNDTEIAISVLCVLQHVAVWFRTPSRIVICKPRVVLKHQKKVVFPISNTRSLPWVRACLVALGPIL